MDAIDLDPNTDSMGENLCATSNPPLVKEARISDDPDNIEYYCCEYQLISNLGMSPDKVKGYSHQ